MNRIDRIAPLISALSDDVFEDFLAAARYAAGDTAIYASLPETEKAKLDAAVARLDAGHGVDYGLVKTRMESELKEPGA